MRVGGARRALQRGTVLDLALVFVAGLAVRLLVVALLRPEPPLDPLLFFLTATSLAHGEGFSVLGVPTAAQLPGYPATLSAAFVLFGSRLLTATVVNAVLGAATAGLVYLVGARLFGRGTGLLGGLLLAVFPSHAMLASVLLAENLATFLLMLAVYVAVAYTFEPAPPGPMALGVLALIAGAGVLVRVELLVWPVALVVAWYLAGRRPWQLARGLLPVLAVMAVVAGAWIGRNAVTMGTPVLATTTASNGIYYSLGPYFQAAPPPDVQFADPGLARDEFEVKASQVQLREGLSYARQHPLEELRRIPVRAWHLVRNDGGAIRWIRSDPDALSSRQEHRLSALSNVVYAVAVLEAALGAPFWLRGRDPRHLLLLLVLGLWTATHVFVFAGQTHYHIPLLPIVSLMAAAGAAAIASRARDAWLRRWAAS